MSASTADSISETAAGICGQLGHLLIAPTHIVLHVVNSQWFVDEMHTMLWVGLWEEWLGNIAR